MWFSTSLQLAANLCVCVCVCVCVRVCVCDSTLAGLLDSDDERHDRHYQLSKMQ